MQLSPLCSGSSGNATYVEMGGLRLLVDAGATGRRIEALLGEAGASAGALDAILLTHEHIDHVQGAGVLARRYGLPVYAAAECFAALPAAVGAIPPGQVRVFEPDRPFRLGGGEILPFSTPHDSAHAVGFLFEDADGRCAGLTALGAVRGRVRARVAGGGALRLAGTPPVAMLRSGAYPYPLKRRILSGTGHLCNEDAAAAIVRLAKRGMREFLLGHLSRENNTPELAAVTVRAALEEAGFGSEVRVTVAARDHATGAFPCIPAAAAR